MTTKPAKHQHDFRERRKTERTRMIGALSAIIERLDGNDKPLAVELRAIAQDGLDGYRPKIETRI